MSEWFQAKVQFLRQQDNGLIKKITETYLVDSMSFTECEARVLKEQGEGVREIKCKSIARSPIADVVFYGDTDMWHKVKVQYSLMDEETEKEKKVTTYLLVNANDAKEAYERTEEHLKEMIVPFRIPKVEESPIVEVFQYEKQAPQGFVPAARALNITITDGKETLEWEKQILSDEHEEECAFEGDSVEAHYTKTPTEYITNPKAGLIDPTDGQAVAFNAMTLETYLEDIRPNYTADVIDSIRSAYKRHSEDLFLMQLSLMAFTRPQREMIADLCENEA